MELYSTDIRIIHDTIWINQRLLYVIGASDSYLRNKRSDFKKSLSPSSIKKLKSKELNVMPATGASWRWSRWDKQYYYDFETIPDQTPVYYKSNLPTEQELYEAEKTACKEVKTYEEFDWRMEIEADKHYDNKDIERIAIDNKYLTPAKAAEIVRARALCLAIMANESTYKELGFKRKSEFWAKSAAYVQERSLEGLKTKNPNSLRNKIAAFPTDKIEQFELLISGKYGNDNKRIVGKFPYIDQNTGEVFKFDIHEAVLFYLWMNPGKANKLNKTGEVGVYTKYQDRIKEYGLDPVASRTATHYLGKFSNRALMSLERDGSDYFNDKYTPYIPQFIPKHTGTVWVADFSGTKILYTEVREKWNTNTGRKQTKQVTKSHYMCRIHDVSTGALIGWSLTDRQGERWEDVQAALYMAMQNNHGHMAMELITDNGGVWTEKANSVKLSLLFKKHRVMQLGNKQSNKAEFYVKMLSNMAREFDNWSMLGFNSSHVDNQANPDYLKPKNIPTKSEAYAQVESLVNKWNDEARANGIIPMQDQKDISRLNPKLSKPEPSTVRYCFGWQTHTKIGRSRSILILDKYIDGSKQSYKFKIDNWEEVILELDHKEIQNINLDVKVCFDETAADIYTLDDILVLTANAVHLSHPSEFEATEDSKMALAGHTASKVSTKAAAENFTDEIQSIMESVDFDEVEEELTYLQRASLSGGKAKDDNLKIQSQRNGEHYDDEDFDFDSTDNVTNQL